MPDMVMTQTHHLVQVLGDAHGKKTRAHWSTTSTDRLVLFVHGFGGSPTATWPDFPTLLPYKASDRPFDFVLFGYDGMRHQASTSASRLLSFLDTFLRDPAELINDTIPSLEKRAAFEYRRVVIVAHSLGAVITRRALLDAHKLHIGGSVMPWLNTIRMVLFAPAHRGAYAAALVSEALTDQPWYLGKLVGYIARFNSPLLIDLQANSVLLQDLAADTAAVAAATNPVPDYIKPRRIIRARDERVVINSDLPVDPPVPPTDLLPTDHFGVCKPRRSDHPALAAVWREL